MSSPSSSPASGSAEPVRPRCLLSVDLEEWSDARLARVPPRQRDRLPPSLDEPVEMLLTMFEAHRARATFFVLGRVARRYPALLRRIAAAHEIGTHGEAHADLRDLGPDRFAADLARSRAVLEDLTGRAVAGFRAPNWSLGACLGWGLPILAAQRFGYDSSLVPGRGLLFVRGGRDLPARPHRLAGTGLWEFPPTIVRLPGATVPAGGAFMRLLPGDATLRILERVAAGGATPHLHVHPWEIGGRPRGAPRSFLLRAGAGGVARKLVRIMQRFTIMAIDDLWRELRVAA